MLLNYYKKIQYLRYKIVKDYFNINFAMFFFKINFDTVLKSVRQSNNYARLKLTLKKLYILAFVLLCE